MRRKGDTDDHVRNDSGKNAVVKSSTPSEPILT